MGGIMAQGKWPLGEDYIYLGKEIDRLREEILRRWSKLNAPPELNDMPRNIGAADRMGDAVSAIIDLEALLYKKIASYTLARRRAEEIIAAFPARERLLLRLRYFEGLNWRQISFRIHYDEDHCRRIHREIMKKLPEEDRSYDA